jgi:hypothetical protein
MQFWSRIRTLFYSSLFYEPSSYRRYYCFFKDLALFIGAGNIIFPPIVAQQAGEHVWLAAFGFLSLQLAYLLLPLWLFLHARLY